MGRTTVKQVRYQTGVDILGFPIYMEHTIIDETRQSFIKKKRTISVLQRIIKQH